MTSKLKYLKDISDKQLEKAIKQAFSFSIMPEANIMSTSVAVYFNGLKPKAKKEFISSIAKEVRRLNELLESDPERNNLISLCAYLYMAMTMNATMCLTDENWLVIVNAGQEFMSKFLLDVLKEQGPKSAWDNDKRGYS